MSDGTRCVHKMNWDGSDYSIKSGDRIMWDPRLDEGKLLLIRIIDQERFETTTGVQISLTGNLRLVQQ